MVYVSGVGGIHPYLSAICPLHTHALWILNIEIQIKDESLSAALQWFFEDRGTCEKQEKEPICRDLQILLKASQMATNPVS